MDKKLICLDTNVLLDFPHSIKEHDGVVLLSHVLRELDKHKQSKNEGLAFKARYATRFLEENNNYITYDIKDYQAIEGYDDNYVDNKIITACIHNGYALCTLDLLLKQKALAFNVEIVQAESSPQEEYYGFKEFLWNDVEIAYFYENLNDNKYDLLRNEYAIINNLKNDFVTCAKWDGQYFQQIQPKGFTTNTFGKFKPYDPYQQCVLDSLMHNQMTLIKGKAGSGKSLIALSYAMSMIEKGKYDKLICFVNPMAARNSARLGFYPGSRNEKLMDSAVGSMLASKFGDKMQVELLINSQKLILLPFSDIRGFDTTGMNAIVHIIESQNLDRDLMKLAVQRCGNDTKLIIDGDYNSQVDHYTYEGTNNGMRRVSEVFRGQDFYGEVELRNIYRSKMAAIADLM
jgi:predicted ribonuclease YlaK